MTTPTVVDANCMKYFQEERVTGHLGVYTTVISKAQSKGSIAIDDRGQAQQEYYDCCRPSAFGLNLCDWIADQLVNRVIVMFTMDRSVEKDLQKMGVPKKDLKWPSIAKGACADVIVTDDIDLFEPQAKSRNAAVKQRYKDNGGCVSKYLYKTHGIEVLTGQNFI